MNTTIKPETLEHLQRSLQRDYRNTRRQVIDEDPERMTQVMLNRLGTTINETCTVLKEISRQLAEINKK
jgi:hypothetical protein